MEFKNVNLVFPDGVAKGDIVFSEEGITGFHASENASTLPGNLYICPGFIDEHIHGALGADVMDGSVTSLKTISRALIEEGVTGFCPTTMTESVPQIEKALLAIKEAKEQTVEGARILGAHLEGPFISKTFKGAQDESNIKKPDIALLNHFHSLSGDNIRIITFAYEEEGAKDLLEYCKGHHITASLGHSDASGEKALEGFENGIHSVTHLFNAQRRFHHRDVGVTGAALISDGVKAELIADFHHSSKDALRLVFKSKKKEDIVLISDATPAKGGIEGDEFTLGNQKIFIEGGVALLDNGTVAGSVLKLNDALRNIAPIAEGYEFHELINLLTVNPAKNLGIYDRYGSIEIGKAADLVIIDETFRVYAAYVNGRLAYRNPDYQC